MHQTPPLGRTRAAKAGPGQNANSSARQVRPVSRSVETVVDALMSKQAISVLVVDSQPLVADALRLLLNMEPDLSTLDDDPKSGLETVKVALQKRPEIAVIDYWMPDMDGAAIVRLIKARRPAIKIILLSWFHGTREIQAAFQAGAVGFLPKSLTVHQLAEGVRRAASGETPVYSDELHELYVAIQGRADQAAEIWKQFQEFTPRQIEVLALLAADLSVKQVASRLSIRFSTVRVHIRAMMEKTDTSSYRDIIAKARLCGLIRT